MKGCGQFEHWSWRPWGLLLRACSSFQSHSEATMIRNAKYVGYARQKYCLRTAIPLTDEVWVTSFHSQDKSGKDKRRKQKGLFVSSTEVITYRKTRFIFSINQTSPEASSCVISPIWFLWNPQEHSVIFTLKSKYCFKVWSGQINEKPWFQYARLPRWRRVLPPFH